MSALRWNGRAGWHEVWYVIVAGRFWLRYTIRVPRDPAEEGESALWLVSFTRTPTAWKRTFPLEAFRTGATGWPIEIAGATIGGGEARGVLAGASWELRWSALAPPFRHAHPLVRPLARSEVALTAPALEASGWIELDGERHELDRAPGHAAHLWGSRLAERWAWAHATLPGGRWVEALTAKLPGLPELSLHASERGAANSPLALVRTRSRLDPPGWHVGPYEVSAARTDFLGVTYTDTDGSELVCYHAERARLRGPGVESDDAAFEIATRAKLPGWTVSL